MEQDKRQQPPPKEGVEAISTEVEKKGRTIKEKITTVLIFSFVLFHLCFLFMRNVVGVLDDKKFDKFKKAHPYFNMIHAPLNKYTSRYEKTFGIDQGWLMFTSPIDRQAPFPAVRLEFSDDSTEIFLSDNEPRDMNSYFRFGMARLRKYEHHIITSDLKDTYKEPLLERYCRWRVSEWRKTNPQDKRKIFRVTLIRRVFTLPKPSEPPTAVKLKKTIDEASYLVKEDWK